MLLSLGTASIVQGILDGNGQEGEGGGPVGHRGPWRPVEMLIALLSIEVTLVLTGCRNLMLSWVQVCLSGNKVI